MLIVAILLLLFTALLIALNLCPRLAYFLYKTPKIHYIAKFLCFKNREYLLTSRFTLPKTTHVVIDDLGWQDGSDLRKAGGPSRLITTKSPELSDYESLVNVSQAVGTRLTGLFVVSELDKTNACAKAEYNIPQADSNATEFGLEWDNSDRDFEKAKTLMSFLKSNSANIEFGLHGVRHEYFLEDGIFRAEWGDRKTGQPRSLQHTEKHCKLFKEIIGQYFSKNVLNFPKFFVPPAHAFCFNDSDGIKTLNRYGIKYMCSSCSSQPTMNQIKNSGCFNNGILMLDRTEACVPQLIGYAPKSIATPNWFIGTHFPNFWGGEKKWIRFFNNINKKIDCMVGRNSAISCSQWIYDHYAVVQDANSHVTINNTFMPDWCYENEYLYGMVLKIHLHDGCHISEFKSESLTILDYYEDEHDNAYLMVGDANNTNSALGNKIYSFNYSIGKTPLQDTHFVSKQQTYNVLCIKKEAACITCELEIFGKHHVRLNNPENYKFVQSENLDIIISNVCTNDKFLEFDVDCEEMLGKNILFRLITEE